MYSLKVLKSLDHPDGRNFAVGHDCKSLTLFEVCDLLLNYPKNFAPADELTEDIAKDNEKVKHYASAYQRAKLEVK